MEYHPVAPNRSKDVRSRDPTKKLVDIPCGSRMKTLSSNYLNGTLKELDALVDQKRRGGRQWTAVSKKSVKKV